MTLQEVAGVDRPEPKIYDFNTQRRIEADCNTVLDNHFSKAWNVVASRPLLDQLGADRIFTHKRTEMRVSVEYKNDLLAHQTGNFFCEFDVNGAPGWTKTALAQILIVHLPGQHRALWVDMVKFRRAIASIGRMQKYPTGVCKNKNYEAKGYLYPIGQLEALSEHVVLINPEYYKLGGVAV